MSRSASSSLSTILSIPTISREEPRSSWKSFNRRAICLAVVLVCILVSSSIALVFLMKSHTLTTIITYNTTLAPPPPTPPPPPTTTKGPKGFADLHIDYKETKEMPLKARHLTINSENGVLATDRTLASLWFLDRNDEHRRLNLRQAETRESRTAADANECERCRVHYVDDACATTGDCTDEHVIFCCDHCQRAPDAYCSVFGRNYSDGWHHIVQTSWNPDTGFTWTALKRFGRSDSSLGLNVYTVSPGRLLTNLHQSPYVDIGGSLFTTQAVISSQNLALWKAGVQWCRCTHNFYEFALGNPLHQYSTRYNADESLVVADLLKTAEALAVAIDVEGKRCTAIQSEGENFHLPVGSDLLPLENLEEDSVIVDALLVREDLYLLVANANRTTTNIVHYTFSIQS